MRKSILITAGILVVLILVAFKGISSHKRQALSDVAGTTLVSGAHQVRVVQCGQLLLNAEYNFDVITQAAEYMGSLGSNTGTYLNIAKIAAAADHEVPELAQVLELAVLKQSESASIVELGRLAVAIDNQAERTIWQARRAALLATAEYPDLKTAIAAMKMD